jgi:hypothetical protein
MSNSARIREVQAQLDDVIRKATEDFLSELDEQITDDGPQRLVLGDWVLVTDWMDPDDMGSHWYHRLNSAGLSPHAWDGLLRTGIEL